MARPIQRPPRKNPVLKARAPLTPPRNRSRVALGLTDGAARGVFELQVCRDCANVQYPARELCGACLSDRLSWRPADGRGELVAETTVHHPLENYFRERAPWRMGTVKLDAGPLVLAQVHGDCPPAPARVQLEVRLDKANLAMPFALPEEETPNMADDPQLREMTCDPRYRKVLVTDGKSAVGQAVVKAVAAAGADFIWVGYAEPWKKFPGFDELDAIPQTAMLPLDVTDARSVKEIAGEIGARVDILINTAEHHRTYGIGARYGTDVARREMEVNYMGLLRLAQDFGPAMRARAADGQSSAVAWVNLLSIFALSNYPPQGTFAASKAAAYSLAQCLRAEMSPAGIRVINLFPGPIDEEWNQEIRPPKLAPAKLAEAIVEALVNGTEDVYPGDVAQDWLARWRENPKALERELAG